MPAALHQLVAEAGRLTPRERDVLTAVAARLSNQEIADHFTLSKRTVEHHLSALYAKLGVSTRRDLIAAAQQLAATNTATRTRQQPEGTRAERLWTAQQLGTLTKHTRLQIRRNTQHLRLARARVEQARARTERLQMHEKSSQATAAFARAVRAERAAIAMHEAAARRLDQLAAELETEALRDRDQRSCDRAFTIAATARRHADTARNRAVVARRRLRDEGVELAT